MENEGLEMVQGQGSVVLSLLGGLLLFALVLLLAWFCTRWLGGYYRRGNGSPGGTIRVLERTLVAPDRTLMIVRAGGKVWLLGVTPQSIQPIGELDPADYPEETASDTGLEQARDFSVALQAAVKNWLPGKKQENEDKDE